MNKGVVNFDTERKRIQVKDARIKKGFSLNDMDFFNCYIEADVNNCLFEQCQIRNSNLKDSVLYSNNDVKYSKLSHCVYGGYLNEIKSSSIHSSYEMIINADLTNCIVFDGNVSQSRSIFESLEYIAIYQSYYFFYLF